MEIRDEAKQGLIDNPWDFSPKAWVLLTEMETEAQEN